MLIGIIEERRRKYLKRRISDSPGVPYEPLSKIKVVDRPIMMMNSILLTKLSY